MATEERKGRAYAFFQQPKPGSEIEKKLFDELPDAREMANLPAGMKVDLMRIKDLKGDAALMGLKADALSYQNTHVLEGTLSGATSEETAKQVRDVVANLCNVPGLWERRQPFVGGIAFWNDDIGEYDMLPTGF